MFSALLNASGNAAKAAKLPGVQEELKAANAELAKVKRVLMALKRKHNTLERRSQLMEEDKVKIAKRHKTDMEAMKEAKKKVKNKLDERSALNKQARDNFRRNMETVEAEKNMFEHQRNHLTRENEKLSGSVESYKMKAEVLEEDLKKLEETKKLETEAAKKATEAAKKATEAMKEERDLQESGKQHWKHLFQMEQAKLNVLSDVQAKAYQMTFGHSKATVDAAIEYCDMKTRQKALGDVITKAQKAVPALTVD